MEKNEKVGTSRKKIRQKMCKIEHGNKWSKLIKYEK